ncbi:MAG: sigma-70 family RNA polymerase sigma factor [Chloroflexi bacterium]|nr:sigma-70 family RNA polymerase sigma factor [Chloroflexota bacterium]
MKGNTGLRQFIAQEADTLKATLRWYLRRADLDDSADDLLHDVVVEALRHEGRFQAHRAPRAWMLGIAANLIRRRRAERATRERREPLVRDLYPNDPADDDALFDRVAALAQAHSDTPDAQLEVDALLSRVSAEDAEILRLAILHEMDGAAVAERLGITPGAARVRLHRALLRLRGVYWLDVGQTETTQRGGGRHG